MVSVGMCIWGGYVARGVKTSASERRREMFDGKCSYPTQSLSNNRKFINFLYKNEILRRKLENLLPKVERRKIFPHSNCVLTLSESHFLIARFLPHCRFDSPQNHLLITVSEQTLHPNPGAIILFLLIFHAKERMKPGSVGAFPPGLVYLIPADKNRRLCESCFSLTAFTREVPLRFCVSLMGKIENPPRHPPEAHFNSFGFQLKMNGLRYVNF